MAVGFLIVTVAAASFATYTTLNYFQFYPALTGLHLSIIQLTAIPQGSAMNTTVIFKLENPTDYRGLVVNYFNPVYSIVSGSAVVFATTALDSPIFASYLAPKTPQNVTLQFNSQNPGNRSYQFQFSIDLVLSTFMDQSASFIASYDCISPPSPVPCTQTTLTPRSNLGLGGGGGGGG